MPDRINLNTLYETMGEVKAIAREAKHAAQNTSAKVDALALVVAAQGEIRSHVERMERHSEEQDEKIEMLTADKLRREGAIGLVEWVGKHWPFTIFSLILALFIAWANGKLHL